MILTRVVMLFQLLLPPFYYVDHVDSPAGFSSGPNEEHCWQSYNQPQSAKKGQASLYTELLQWSCYCCPDSIDMGAVY